MRGGPVEKREGEKKRKKRRGRRGIQAKIKPKRYGNYFEYGFLLWNLKVCMNFHAIGWLLVIPKPRVCWDFILTKEVLKLGLVKPYIVQDNHRILSFRMDSWLIESL